MCPAQPELDSESTAIRALIEARLPDPFALLGPHRGDAGTTIRAFHPAMRSEQRKGVRQSRLDERADGR